MVGLSLQQYKCWNHIFWADLWQWYNGTAFWSFKCAHFSLWTTVLMSKCLYFVKSWFNPKLTLNNNNRIVFYSKTKVSMTFSQLICENADGTAFWSWICAHVPPLTNVLVSKCLYILKSPCSLKLRLISNHSLLLLENANGPAFSD